MQSGKKTRKMFKRALACMPSGVTSNYRYWGDDKSLHNKPWSFEEDGALGNDTKAIVKFSVYEGRAPIVTLVKVGVVEHVPHDADGSKF